MEEVARIIGETVDLVHRWEEHWGSFERDPTLDVEEARMRAILSDYAYRLRENYPFFHPRYAGQMLKPPHPIAMAAYAGAMMVNPNNHALDGGPATARMEKEAVAAVAAMFDFPHEALGHLTTSGTIANLEALWVARELRPQGRVAVSEHAHYTHQRMAGLLRMDVEVLPADARGRMAVEALEAAVRSGEVALVVLTAGTTGLGAVDPISDAISLAREYGVRVHVDAAYGGFYRVLARGGSAVLDMQVASDLIAISEADSIVVDPHKHGLQPYGCGCVLFRDPAVGSIYRHDSPYTYFTSDELHLGEISIECSRSGAAAGAFWATLQAFPLVPDGIGAVLAACRNAAREWYGLLCESQILEPLVEPHLDIVSFYRRGLNGPTGIDAASQRLFERAMRDPDDPIYLSVLRVARHLLREGHLGGEGRPDVRVLRSVLMKPEHQGWIPRIHARLEALARECG